MNLCVIVFSSLVATALADGEAPSALGTGIAATLIVGIGFQMACIFLFNFEDADIRKYSYEALSGIVAMLIAILVLDAFNILIQTYVLDGATMEVQFGTYTIETLFLFVVLQVRSIGSARHLGMLVSNMLGLAAINMWCTLQSYKFFGSNSSNSLLILPLMLVIHMILVFIFDGVRSKRLVNEVDESAKLWDEAVEEWEIVSTSFALSFLSVQSIRYAICGSLPDKLGIITSCEHKAVALLLVFLIFSASFAVLDNFIPEHGRRLMAVVKCTLSMCPAWCLTFGSMGIVSRLLSIDDKMALAAIAAPIVTCISVVAVLIGDKAVHGHRGGRRDAAIEKFITLVGVCVVFAWLQCFRVAVSELPGEPMWIALAMLAFAVMFMLPAWRGYILPTATVQQRGAEELNEKLLRGSSGGEGIQ